ncbi:MFS transporter OS=Lysinibacillus sphaericus OX=1421 GN=yhjX_1 PE=4 SV=1 [Lysinibacillus sphaericus]
MSAIKNAYDSYIPVFYVFAGLIAISLIISLTLRADVRKQTALKTAEQKVGDVSATRESLLSIRS